MDTITLLRRQIARAHTVVNDTLADVTPEQAHWPPPGRAHPIGALVMHLARSEDGIVNRMVAGRPTLLETTYAGKTGVNALPPMGPDWGDWACSVQVDLPVLLAYYQAVQANTIGFLDGLGADHLNRQVDLGQPGPGTMTVAEVLGTIIVPHTAMHCGEISCLKGLQSARGYTF